MGETSVDTQREIDSLRDDLSATVGELERRAKRATDIKAHVQEHRLLACWVLVCSPVSPSSAIAR